MDLKAVVRLTAPGHDVTWDAKVDRVGDTIDPRTQSVTVVVTVDQPVGQAEAGSRPQLRRNMFVEVDLSGARHSALAVPASAVVGNTAFVVSPDGKVEKRDVTVAYEVGSLAVVTAGLSKGDRLVVSDATLLIPGMSVKPVVDKALASSVAGEALGTDGAK